MRMHLMRQKLRLSRMCSRTSVRATALAAVTVLVAAFASTGVASAAGQFGFLQAGFTQELYGTAPVSPIFGGVAFAPNADVWVDSCAPSGGALDRFDNSTTTPVNGSNVHPLVAGSPFASNAGCGLTNNPDGFLYSNTFPESHSTGGVAQINASTGTPTGVVFGAGEGFLGITTDPQTGNLVYVTISGRILTAPPGGSSSTFSTATLGSFIDGIAFDPTGNFLFVSNRTLNVVMIIARSGALVQNSAPIPGVPDGISFHSSTPKFVVTNNNDGSMTRLDFPGNDYTMPPVSSVFASGGFRGDLSQVGPDGCIYLTQDGTRYDNGTTSTNNSIVRICPGFAPPPGVGPKPHLGLTKTDNLNPAKYETVAQVVKYTLKATNEGNTTLHNVSVSDSPALEGFSCTPSIPAASLATGASISCTGNHTITQADWEAGSFKDTASATSNEAKAPNAEDTITALGCSANPPNVNVRWHYSANGSSGSWSGTGGAKCGKTITLGPQAMEGNLKVSPGATIKAGYDFTLPGNKSPFTVSFTEGRVVFAVHCVSGVTPSEPTFTMTLPDQSYSVTNQNWYPSGEQNSPLVYQGEIAAPDLCSGGQLRLDQGGTFSAFMTIH
jgi:uncharacterized repeat protein (TIGR01451 family)